MSFVKAALDTITEILGTLLKVEESNQVQEYAVIEFNKTRVSMHRIPEAYKPGMLLSFHLIHEMEFVAGFIDTEGGAISGGYTFRYDTPVVALVVRVDPERVWMDCLIGDDIVQLLGPVLVYFEVRQL